MSISTKRLAVAGACAFAGALAMAPGANAAFTLSDCAGDSITGRGASFQETAQNQWRPAFRLTSTATAPAACPSSTGFSGTVGYEPQGSGAGRTAFGGGSSGGARNASIRFVGYDEAPKPAEQAQIEEGANVSGAADSDDGNLLTIPNTSGAITVLVNVPDGCTTSGEIQPTNAQVEDAFAGDADVDTWGELEPGIAGTHNGTACANVPLTRVARLDSSGTTYQFKAFLDAVNPSRDLDAGTAGTQSWRLLPGESSQTEAANQYWPGPGLAATGTNFVRGAANGASSQVDRLSATEGGIAYADLAIARDKGYYESDGGAFPGDHRWLTLRDAAGNLVEPTDDPDSRDTFDTGSNCDATTQYSNVPLAGAEGDWSTVVPALATGAYPICALTYVGAWQDACDVYGDTAAEQQHARTVKDYLQFVLSSYGQNQAVDFDYGALPASIKSIADTGVAAVDWKIAAGGGTCS